MMLNGLNGAKVFEFLSVMMKTVDHLGGTISSISLEQIDEHHAWHRHQYKNSKARAG